MKKLLLSAALAALCHGAAFAQNNAATSTTKKNALGREVTTYKDRFGNVVGTSTVHKDGTGREVTTYKDRFGNTTGTSTTRTRLYGSPVTTYKDRFGNIGGQQTKPQGGTKGKCTTGGTKR